MRCSNTEVYLNKKWWQFNSNVIAVYVLREENGLNFMLRVIDRSAVALYKHRIQKSHTTKLAIIIPCILALLVILYLNRNLKFGQCIIKDLIYTGMFVKNPCLIYRVSNRLLKEYRRAFGPKKLSGVVTVLSESEGWMHPLMVTEMTYQFRPVRPDQTIFTPSPGEGPLKSRTEQIILRASNREHQDMIRGFKDGLFAVVKCVEEIHSHEIAHGRICPENVRVATNGQIKLQCMIDSQGWRSPRQLKSLKSKGLRAKESDDLFSLGCLLHFYLTGYHPYDSRDFKMKQRKSDKDAPNWHTKDDEASGDMPIVDTDSPHRVDKGRKASESVLHGIRSALYWLLRQAYGMMLLGLQSMLRRLILCVLPTTLVTTVYTAVTTAHAQTLGRVFKGSPLIPADQIHTRMLPDEISRHIEFNILYGTRGLRLTNQVEYDMIYHCFKSSANELNLKLTAHPFFWNDSKCLEFICDVSDFIETNSALKPRVEKNSHVVFVGSWMEYLDEAIVKGASSKRNYDHQSVCDLIRLIRNCHRHYQELKGGAMFDLLEGNLFFYLSSVFPGLLMYLYRSPVFKNQLVLQKYY